MRRVDRDPRDERERRDGIREIALIGECGLLRGRDEIPIDRTAAQKRQIRARVGNDMQFQARRPRPAAPIRRIRSVDETLAAIPAHEAVRSVADRMRAKGVLREILVPAQEMRGQHVLRRRAVTENRGDGRRPRRTQRDAHGVVVDPLGLHDPIVTFARADRIARVDDRAEREEHVACGDGRPVLPVDVAPQPVGDDAPVMREIAVGDCRNPPQEHRDRTAPRIDIDERLEGQPRDLTLDAVGIDMREERIEGARIGRQIEANRRRGRFAPRFGLPAARQGHDNAEHAEKAALDTEWAHRI